MWLNLLILHSLRYIYIEREREKHKTLTMFDWIMSWSNWNVVRVSFWWWWWWSSRWMCTPSKPSSRPCSMSMKYTVSLSMLELCATWDTNSSQLSERSSLKPKCEPFTAIVYCCFLTCVLRRWHRKRVRKRI